MSAKTLAEGEPRHITVVFGFGDGGLAQAVGIGDKRSRISWPGVIEATERRFGAFGPATRKTPGVPARWKSHRARTRQSRGIVELAREP